jgi:transposase
MLLAGHGTPITVRTAVVGQVRAWTATKNQLLGQLDRAFPGLTLALPDVLGTKVGRLVAEQFAHPARLATLGEARFVRFAATRGLQVRHPVAERLVEAAREALPTVDAAVARRVLAADLRLLHELEQEITAAEQALAILLPDSPFATLMTVPGWGGVWSAPPTTPVRLATRTGWPGPAHIYRASGLSPAQYESAGRRRDLSVGLWLCDPAAKRYAAGLKARGKRGGIIACALAHRATRIAHALVRDQRPYDPAGPEHTRLIYLSPTAASNAVRVGAVNVRRPQPAFYAGEDERR